MLAKWRFLAANVRKSRGIVAVQGIDSETVRYAHSYEFHVSVGSRNRLPIESLRIPVVASIDCHWDFAVCCWSAEVVARIVGKLSAY